MELYILRHAIAVERGTPGFKNDSERPLTKEGERKLRRIAKSMKRMELTFDWILTSPFVRAKRTADIMASVLGLQKRVDSRDELGADRNPRVFLAQLSKLDKIPESTIVVGHEPFLSELISLLITGSTSPCLTLKKAGLCKLSVEKLRVGRCATLQWLLTPRQLLLL